MDFLRRVLGGFFSTSSPTSSNLSKEDLERKRQESPATLSEAEWKELLDRQTFSIARQKGTEHPFSSKLYDEHRTGQYLCACCEQPLFASEKVSYTKLARPSKLCFSLFSLLSFSEIRIGNGLAKLL